MIIASRRIMFRLLNTVSDSTRRAASTAAVRCSTITATNTLAKTTPASKIAPIYTTNYLNNIDDSDHELRNHRFSTSSRRSFATGTRGARGHGWYVNYKAGKGGRHMQGEYSDESDPRSYPPNALAWNQAVLALGKTTVYLDIVLVEKSLLAESEEEGKAAREKDASKEDSASSEASESSEVSESSEASTSKNQGKDERHRLIIDLASEVMPETTNNFLELLELYKGTTLYRLERMVGLCGGAVVHNNKLGQASEKARTTSPGSSPFSAVIPSDPLALYHVPGTITMLVKKVEEVDSRFMICHGGGVESDIAYDESQKTAFKNLHHLDGIHRAFGQLRPESLKIVKKWGYTILTRSGVPTLVDITVVDCGILAQDSNPKSADIIPEASAAKVNATASA